MCDAHHRMIGIVFLAFLSIVSGECPTDWSRFQDICLGFFEHPLTWSKAQATCESYGARLATLENKVKDMNMKMFLQVLEHLNGDYVWVGGSDLMKDSHWEWNNQNVDTFTYTDWYPGQPNNLHNNKIHGEHCLGIHLTALEYGWVDMSCEEVERAYVCEKDKG